MLRRALAGGGPRRRETRPLVNVAASLLAAAALTLLAYAVRSRWSRSHPSPATRPSRSALAVVLIGFFVLVTRRRALSQLVGFLLMDNGITAVAFLTTAGVPLVVELGVSLDVLLAVLVLQVLDRPDAGGVRRHRPRRTAGAARLMTTRSSLLVPGRRAAAGAAVYAVAGWRRATAWSARAPRRPAARRARAGVDGGRRAVQRTLAGVLRADALSAFMLIVIGAVALLAALASPAHLAAETLPGVRTGAPRAATACWCSCSWPRWRWPCWPPTSGCCGSRSRPPPSSPRSWSGSAAPAPRWRPRGSTSCICSVGIALALLGTVLLNYAARARRARSAGLDWAALAAGAPSSTRASPASRSLLLVLGFGTKAGLAPLHAWLPDAHSQAPAPVSALMSGVLLSVAFYAILRVKVIADAALGPGFARALLLVAALASLAVAASLLLAQRDYKRMLAYSSIEHMGLLALGAATGSPLAIDRGAAAHPRPRPGQGVLFLGAGRILQPTGTSRIDRRARPGRPPPAARRLLRRSACSRCSGCRRSACSPASSASPAPASPPASAGPPPSRSSSMIVIAAALLSHTAGCCSATPPDGPGTATRAPSPAASTAAALIARARSPAPRSGSPSARCTALLQTAATTLTGTP